GLRRAERGQTRERSGADLVVGVGRLDPAAAEDELGGAVKAGLAPERLHSLTELPGAAEPRRCEERRWRRRDEGYRLELLQERSRLVVLVELRETNAPIAKAGVFAWGSITF